MSPEQLDGLKGLHQSEAAALIRKAGRSVVLVVDENTRPRPMPPDSVVIWARNGIVWAAENGA
jgi:hypothetical protein